MTEEPELHFGKYDENYAPMLAAAGHKEKYLKAMAGQFAPDIQVN